MKINLHEKNNVVKSKICFLNSFNKNVSFFLWTKFLDFVLQFLFYSVYENWVKIEKWVIRETL